MIALDVLSMAAADPAGRIDDDKGRPTALHRAWLPREGASDCGWRDPTLRPQIVAPLAHDPRRQRHPEH